MDLIFFLVLYMNFFFSPSQTNFSGINMCTIIVAYFFFLKIQKWISCFCFLCSWSVSYIWRYKRYFLPWTPVFCFKQSCQILKLWASIVFRTWVSATSNGFLYKVAREGKAKEKGLVCCTLLFQLCCKDPLTPAKPVYIKSNCFKMVLKILFDCCLTHWVCR